MYGLAGKVVLVTGSGRRRGLGIAILERLAAEGCRVVVSDLAVPQPLLDRDHIGTGEEMEAIAADLRRAGAEAMAVPLDVRDEDQIRSAVQAIVERYGRLDVLVNNAGIGYLMQPLLETTAASWRTVLDVNLTGAFLCIRHAAAQMVRQGEGGRIINIASQAAKSGHRHLAAYTASKHGLIGLTRTAAIELGDYRITVNAICPNHVTTGLGAEQNRYFAALRNLAVEEYLADMRARIPLGRVGLATDTAAVCAFLCSDEAGYITGEALNVSGGVEMH
jgi:NAD(P)-dependent dehydrogenase (short-subunit alcohol dehydrogenase family)